MKFMSEDFLLSNETAKRIYHSYAEKMPIVDYHCHISPQEIAQNKKFDNITQIILVLFALGNQLCQIAHLNRASLAHKRMVVRDHRLRTPNKGASLLHTHLQVVLFGQESLCVWRTILFWPTIIVWRIG